jgi:hypothetical protein
MSQKSIDVAFFPDVEYYDFRREVEALPLRKQVKWHRTIQDNNGVLHRVRFLQGELVFTEGSQLLTMKPLGETKLNVVEFPYSITEEEFRRLNTAQERGGNLACREEIHHLIDEAATGNHRSKPHKVRVPTKAGEPVRS